MTRATSPSPLGRKRKQESSSVLSETINGKRSVSLNVAVALEKALGIPANIWMNLQTQYDLDTANIAERDNQRETVSVTIPVRDRNLLQELVRKFGWCKLLQVPGEDCLRVGAQVRQLRTDV